MLSSASVAAGLHLEPEYLLDRLRDECAQLNLPYQTTQMLASGEELMRIEVNVPDSAEGSGVRMMLHVVPQDTEGAYSILFTRLKGDTFQYHKHYQMLRDRIQDLKPDEPKCTATPMEM